MAIRKIARMGHDILKRVSAPIDDATAPEIAQLAADMIETCEDVGGNGLAAVQIYVPLRMFVYRVRKSVMPEGVQMAEIPWTVAINPAITALGDRKKFYWERCLSLPGLYGQVARFTDIRFEASGLDGERTDITAHGFHARLLQHENDHLDGHLYPMRMEDMATLGYISELGPEAYPALPRDAADFIDPTEG